MKILTILFVLYINISFAQSPSIEYKEQTITVDGILDEKAWQNLDVFTDFNNFYPINDGKAVLQTEVKVFQNEKFLNIAVIYHDTTKRVNVSSLKRDNYEEAMHLSDCFGVVIDPYRNQDRGYFFGLNGANTQVDGLIGNYRNLNTSWNAKWQGKTKVIGTKKIYEMSIPLSSINYDLSSKFWNFQFYIRDTKINLYSTWTKFPRGFLQFDTRYLGKIEMEKQVKSKSSRITIIPSITVGNTQNTITNNKDFTIKPSLDAQYNLTSGLRLNMTLNPDFSQIDVDKQVTNLTRFSVTFPERRSFFLENSDLFSNLGTYSGNPFNSRRIGANGDIKFGLKLSGNILKKTRIGIMDVQSKTTDSISQNYAVIVAQQQISSLFTTTAFFINRQQTRKIELIDDFNRVMGVNLNFISLNKKWTGVGGYARAITENKSTDNNFYNLELVYKTRKTFFINQVTKVDQNYITDLGFVPRLYNFDSELKKTIRAGYTNIYNKISKTIYPKTKYIDSYRWFNCSSQIFLDEKGSFNEAKLQYNTALFFKNLSSIYINIYHDIIELKYGFKPIKNNFILKPGDYTSTAIRFGYNSDFTKQLFFSTNAQFGSFYGGKRQRFSFEGGYRMLPRAAINLNYEYNHLEFSKNEQDFHLIGLVTEVFFSNKLNWTTYFQYNTQYDNININSRLQWEYRPLSYIYLVYTDNYNNEFEPKNKGIHLKISYWLNM